MFITPLKKTLDFFSQCSTIIIATVTVQFRETHSEIDGAGVLVPKFPCEKELIHSVSGFKPCNFGQSSEIILQICSHTSNQAFSNDFSHRDISTLLRGDFVVCVVNKSTNTNVVEQTPHGNCQNGVTLCCCCCSNAFKRVRRRERIFPFTKKKCCSKTSSFLEVVKSSYFRHCFWGASRSETSFAARVSAGSGTFREGIFRPRRGCNRHFWTCSRNLVWENSVHKVAWLAETPFCGRCDFDGAECWVFGGHLRHFGTYYLKVLFYLVIWRPIWEACLWFWLQFEWKGPRSIILAKMWGYAVFTNFINSSDRENGRVSWIGF